MAAFELWGKIQHLAVSRKNAAKAKNDTEVFTDKEIIKFGNVFY